jgi:excisionase family DNA binding protein
MKNGNTEGLNTKREPSTTCVPSIGDRLITSPEAATFLGISTRTLHNLCSSGQIPYYKFGRRNRYKKTELENLILTEARGYRP